MKTTLNKIKSHSPCEVSWRKLLKSLGKTQADDTEVSIECILDLLGIEDALWALRAVDGYDREIRLLVCDYAERVLLVYEEAYPDDKRPRQAIEVARRYANGEATEEELDAAAADAWDAVWTAWGGAWEAARAANAACSTSQSAAGATSWHAVKAAMTVGVSRDSELEWQEQKLRELLKTTHDI